MAGIGSGGRGVGLAGVLGLAAALVLVLVATGGDRAEGAAERAGGLKLKTVENFKQPVYVTGAPGRASRKLLFVVEQGGKVRVVRKGRKLRKPFLNISSKTQADGERGFLSIAFDPGYAHNRRFYAYYTDRDGDIRVSQFRRSGKSKVRASRRERKVIEIPHPGNSNHNGGTVAFGPDGHLYLGTGDGGAACDPPENAQDTSSLLGKLLRIDPRPKGGYTVPADNPFAASPGRDEIFAYGLRNPFRFSFDRKTGTIAIGDVGQYEWEEVDYTTLAAAGGANFGWDAYEGTHPLDLGGSSFCAQDDPTPLPSSTVPPIHEYPHSGAGHTGCAITGGIVVRDRRLRSLAGRYIYADYCTGDLRSLAPSQSGAQGESSTGLSLTGPTSFYSGRHGRVYITAGRSLLRLK